MGYFRMFSPLADTTFSSFFSGVVSGAGLVGPQLGPTNILSHSPPPPPAPRPAVKMRWGSGVSVSGLPASLLLLWPGPWCWWQ